MSEIVYSNRILKVERSSIRRKGHRYAQYVVNYRTPVVVILPILGRDEIIIERQYRGALRGYLYEIPAGRVDRGESILACARRELREETGYVAKSVRPLLSDYPSPGIMSSMRYYFIATGLRKGRSSPNKDEDITIEKMKMEKVVRFIKTHRIVDSKTITAVLFYSMLKKR